MNPSSIVPKGSTGNSWNQVIPQKSTSRSPISENISEKG